MATIEKRIADLEYIIGNLPEDLDVRLSARDEHRAASREALDRHWMRSASLEAALLTRLGAVEKKLEAVEQKLASIEGLLLRLK